MRRALRRASANPIFRGGLQTFGAHSTRWAHAMNYLAFLSTVLFITWPKEGFLSLRDLPFTYNALGGSVMIVLTYLNLSQGARRLFGSTYISLHDWLRLGPVEAGPLLRGYLAVSFLDTLFFWALSVPLLVLAASVSGEATVHWCTGLGILLVCVGSYRVVGVALLTCLERDEFLLYISVRALCLFFLLGTGMLAPWSNPVLAFADASIWPSRLHGLTVYEWHVPAWLVTVGLHLLLGGLFFIIALFRVRWVRQRRVVSEAHEEGTEYG